MTNPKDWKPDNRILVRDDERKQIPDFSKLVITPPIVGIFDEPKRCYPLNNQWAKIIFGLVDWLLEISVWQSASDESYSAILAIQEFLKGENCMDCTDVENCLSTSQIIADMQAAIATNAANIATNTGNIGNNANAIIALDTRVSANENTIVQHSNDIQNNTTAININTTDIGDLRTDVDIHQAFIDNHTALLDNHEQRIALLENAPGGGGSYDTLTVTVKELIAEYVFSVDGQGVAFDIPSGYDDLEAVMFGIADSSSIGSVSIRFNNDLTNTYYYQDVESGTPALGANLAWLREETDLSAGGAMATIFIPNIQSLTWKYAFALSGSRGGSNPLVHASRGVQWRNTAPITQVRFETDTGVKMQAGTTWRIYGYRQQEVLVPIVPTDPLVTFDVGGYAYDDTHNNIGVLSATGGNPDGCMIAQGLSAGTGCHIDVSIPDNTDIYNVKVDIFASHAATVYFYRGGIAVGNIPVSTFNAWHTVDFAAYQAAWFPIVPQSGQPLHIFCTADGNADEIRMDNIVIDITP